MITDDDLLLHVRQSLSGLRMQTPVETIMRTGHARQRRRRLIRSAGVAAVGVTAAVVGTSVTWSHPAPPVGSTNPPPTSPRPAGTTNSVPVAFTVSTSSKGVNLSMYKGRQLDPDALRQALARQGIPALVTVGEFCRTPGQPGGQLPTPKEPGDGSLDLTIDPAAIPPGAELSIGYFQNAIRFLLIAKNAPLSCSAGSSQPAYHQTVRSGKIHSPN